MSTPCPSLALEQDVDVEHYAIEQEIWRLAEINAKRFRDVTSSLH